MNLLSLRRGLGNSPLNHLRLSVKSTSKRSSVEEISQQKWLKRSLRFQETRASLQRAPSLTLSQQGANLLLLTQKLIMPALMIFNRAWSKYSKSGISLAMKETTFATALLCIPLAITLPARS